MPVLVESRWSVAERCMSCECMACGCIPHDDGKLVVDMNHPLIMWWVILGIAIGVNIVFESLAHVRAVGSA